MGIVDATGKKIRGKPEGKVDDYDQYGMFYCLNCILEETYL